VVGCGDGSNGMLRATGSVAEAARAVEAALKSVARLLPVYIKLH
jgi:hypothetical protein